MRPRPDAKQLIPCHLLQTFSHSNPGYMPRKSTAPCPNVPCTCSIAGRQFQARIHRLEDPEDQALVHIVNQQADDAQQPLSPEQVDQRVEELRQERVSMGAIPLPFMEQLMALGHHIRLNEP